MLYCLVILKRFKLFSNDLNYLDICSYACPPCLVSILCIEHTTNFCMSLLHKRIFIRTSVIIEYVYNEILSKFWLNDDKTFWNSCESNKAAHNSNFEELIAFNETGLKLEQAKHTGCEWSLAEVCTYTYAPGHFVMCHRNHVVPFCYIPYIFQDAQNSASCCKFIVVSLFVFNIW